MVVIFVLLAIWFAIFLFASYHAIINGYTIAKWATGICIWMMFVFLCGIKMFG